MTGYQLLLAKHMQKHNEILNEFSELPKALRQHIQTYYKSERPEVCIRCENVCYKAHISVASQTKWIPVCICRSCEVFEYYGDSDDEDLLCF